MMSKLPYVILSAEAGACFPSVLTTFAFSFCSLAGNRQPA